MSEPLRNDSPSQDGTEKAPLAIGKEPPFASSGRKSTNKRRETKKLLADLQREKAAHLAKRNFAESLSKTVCRCLDLHQGCVSKFHLEKACRSWCEVVRRAQAREAEETRQECLARQEGGRGNPSAGGAGGRHRGCRFLQRLVEGERENGRQLAENVEPSLRADLVRLPKHLADRVAAGFFEPRARSRGAPERRQGAYAASVLWEAFLGSVFFLHGAGSGGAGAVWLNALSHTLSYGSSATGSSPAAAKSASFRARDLLDPDARAAGDHLHNATVVQNVLQTQALAFCYSSRIRVRLPSGAGAGGKAPFGSLPLSRDFVHRHLGPVFASSAEASPAAVRQVVGPLVTLLVYGGVLVDAGRCPLGLGGCGGEEVSRRLWELPFVGRGAEGNVASAVAVVGPGGLGLTGDLVGSFSLLAEIATEPAVEELQTWERTSLDAQARLGSDVPLDRGEVKLREAALKKKEVGFLVRKARNVRYTMVRAADMESRLGGLAASAPGQARHFAGFRPGWKRLGWGEAGPLRTLYAAALLCHLCHVSLQHFFACRSGSARAGLRWLAGERTFLVGRAPPPSAAVARAPACCKNCCGRRAYAHLPARWCPSTGALGRSLTRAVEASLGGGCGEGCPPQFLRGRSAVFLRALAAPVSLSYSLGQVAARGIVLRPTCPGAKLRIPLLGGAVFSHCLATGVLRPELVSAAAAGRGSPLGGSSVRVVSSATNGCRTADLLVDLQGGPRNACDLLHGRLQLVPSAGEGRGREGADYLLKLHLLHRDKRSGDLLYANQRLFGRSRLS